jgi:UPF0176 protein
MEYKVAALYKFAKLPDFQTLQAPLLTSLNQYGIKGSILIALEGVNGTIAGEPEKLDLALVELGNITGILNIEPKFSFAPKMPFRRMKVRLKKEIVTIGDVKADPTEKVGTYVEAKDWNALISDPDVILIDTRNAMFCTGGIRCEKASSFMLHEGFENVFHLKGGILKYLEDVPKSESTWEGSCFVFDERVAVGHGLEISDYALCYGCQMPLSASDRTSSKYELGVSCPHCRDNLSEQQIASGRQRQKQINLAAAKGAKHLK